MDQAVDSCTSYDQLNTGMLHLKREIVPYEGACTAGQAISLNKKIVIKNTWSVSVITAAGTISLDSGYYVVGGDGSLYYYPATSQNYLIVKIAIVYEDI